MMNNRQAKLHSEVRREEKNAARLTKLSGRSCESCSMCCRIFAIYDAELSKAGGELCLHHKDGRCSIYQNRPKTCRVFSCQWLTNTAFEDNWHPEQSRIVVTWYNAAGTYWLQFTVDPDCPERWREEPYFSGIKSFCWRGLRGEHGKVFATKVCAGEDNFLILPHREIKNVKSGYLTGNGYEFEWTEADNAQIATARRSMQHA
jgi:hypothetical protein